MNTISKIVGVDKKYIKRVAQLTGFIKEYNRLRRIEAYNNRGKFNIVINPRKIFERKNDDRP